MPNSQGIVVFYERVLLRSPDLDRVSWFTYFVHVYTDMYVYRAVDHLSMTGVETNLLSHVYKDT